MEEREFHAATQSRPFQAYLCRTRPNPESAFYCVEAFRRIPRQQDGCTQVIQEQSQIPSRVVMIFHNDNRQITEGVERYMAGQRLGFTMTCYCLVRICRIR